MCLIIYSKNPSKISINDMEESYNSNKDGFGLMYIKDNKIITEKILPKNFDDCLQLFNKHKNNCKEIGLHWRFKTVGNINLDNCHPHQVLKNEVYLMHNGPSLPIPILDYGRSDTNQFIKYYFRNLIIRNTEILEDKTFIKSINDFIGSDKLLVLNRKSEKFTIFNSQNGYFENDCWYSNSYLKKSKIIEKYSFNQYPTPKEDEYYCDCDNVCYKNNNICDCYKEEINENTELFDNINIYDLASMDLEEIEKIVKDKIELEDYKTLSDCIYNLVHQY
jgi:predicted glutamine amidotransferase